LLGHGIPTEGPRRSLDSLPLQLAPTLTGGAKWYEHFSRKVRFKSKPIKTRQWGRKLIALLKGTATRAQGSKL